MTSLETAAHFNRSESYDSETGSFWNFSCTESEADTIDDEDVRLGATMRHHRRQTTKQAPQVQALNVRHVIGLNKNSSSTPLVFGSDGLVAYIAGCFVTLYDLRTYCQVQHLSMESRKRTFACLAISEDANMLAAGEQGQDPSVIVWQLDTCPIRPPSELKGHKDTITAISFSPNGKYLATIGNIQDSQLILWDCQMESVLCSQLLRIQANLTSISFSMDSKVLYTSGKSQFTMWSLCQKAGKSGANACGVTLTSKPAMPKTEKVSDVVDVRVGNTGKSSFIYAVTKNGVLYKLRFHKGGIKLEKKVDLRVTRAFSMAVGGNKIAVSCASGIVKIIGSKNLSIEATITKPANDPEKSSLKTSSDSLYCAFDELGSSLAVAYSDGSIAFWDAEDSSQIRCYHTLKTHLGCISDIFSIQSESAEQKLVDQNVVKAMRSPNIHNPQAVESEFATCSDKGTICLWNLKMQTAHSRQHAMISPATHRSGMWGNPRVDIEMKSVSVNHPPASKSKVAKVASRKTKDALSTVKRTKESKRSLGTKPLPSTSKPKKAAAKKPPAIPSTSKPKRPVHKSKVSGATSIQKGKRMVATPGSMRLSTELTGSMVMKAPVVAVSKPGRLKNSSADAEPSRTAPTEDPHFTCIRASPDCMHLVVGDDKGMLRIYHLGSMKLLSKKGLHQSPITAIEFSLPGKNGELLLATGAQDGTVSVLEMHNNDFKVKLEKEDHSEPVTGLSFSPEGKVVVSCGKDNYLYLESLDPADFESEEDMELFLSRHFLMTSTFEAMHFNAARSTYMLACSDHFIRVFNVMGQFVHAIQIPVELGAPTKIIQGPIPSMLITCHSNNRIGIFEYFTGRLLAVGEGHTKLTGALLINNGRNLVTTGDDGVMVIWELPEELCRRCIALPVQLGVPQTESGYANELFFKIQKEKERASKIESGYRYSEEKCSGGTLIDRMASFENSLLSGASTPIQSRPGSRMSGVGLPMVSPVGHSSQPMMMPSKEAVHLPSWMSKADGMSDDGLLDGFGSASPSIYSRAPRLDLRAISDTDDESLPHPMQLNRGHSLVNSRFNDLDSLPIDDFIAGRGFSRRGLSFENDRFNHPVDSTRWGRLSKESYSGSPACGLHPCSSLAQYMDERSEFAIHHAESIDRGYSRPTGPEPPSSVSCTSDSRNSTPFNMLPTSCFDSEAMMRNFHDAMEGNDEQFVLLRSPYSSSRPIGPHIHRIASRTPQSMYSDDKTVYTRPNSEEHTRKMLSQFHPASDDSMSPIPSPFQAGTRNVYWGEAIGEEDDAAYLTDMDEAAVKFVCQPEDRPDTPVVRAGGRMNKNPLYSSGSEASDVAHYNTRPMASSIGSLADLCPLDKEVSFIDIAEETAAESREKATETEDPLKRSMALFWKAVKSSVADSLQKLKEDIAHHESLTDCSLPTFRKQAYVDKAQQEVAAFLENLQVQGCPSSQN